MFLSCLYTGKARLDGAGFDGLVFDLRIYNGVLSPSEVAKLASSTVINSCQSSDDKKKIPEPRAWYPLKENALDYAGSGLHGKQRTTLMTWDEGRLI